MYILGIPWGLRIKIQNYLLSFVQHLYLNRNGSSASFSSAEGRVDGDAMVFEGIDRIATATATANDSWHLIDSPPNESSIGEQWMSQNRGQNRYRDRGSGSGSGSFVAAAAAEYSSSLFPDLNLGLGVCDFYDENYDINHECGANSCFSESR